MSPFVSLNSWAEPGTVLQAEEPDEEISGGPDDWAHLREMVARRGKSGREGGHPRSAAIGYITYEGAFRFGWFPRVSPIRGDTLSERWKERRAEVEKSATPDPARTWQANQTRDEFEARVRGAQDYIAAGDIYQVNLAQRFSQRFSGNPYGLFEHLMARSPAPGSAFLDFGDVCILCSSPELFMRVEGRRVTTRPIKGTRPRGVQLEQDEQLAQELLADPKELAELVMITDLERNDLGRICEYGTVAVTQLAQLERFAHVFHLVSTVQGRLRGEVDALEAVSACIPGGSISGAPKKRACEIIQEIEGGSRGIYTGLVGYFDDRGDAAFSLAIRTQVLESGCLHFSVGSGITASSKPAEEYQETLHKAAGMMAALTSYRHAGD